MSITPRHVHAQIAAAASVLDNLSRRLPAAVHAARLSVTSPDRTGGAEDAGIRSKGHITDPTGQAAISGMTAYEHTFDDFEQQLGSLRLTLALLTGFADRWAPNAGVRIRCGEMTPNTIRRDPWYSGDVATCTTWAETWVNAAGEERPRSDGLCRKHRAAWDGVCQHRVDEVA